MEKTPLYDEHVKLSGKMVDFAGFWLPVHYASGILAEHQAVRTKAGLFDVSHMGEFLLTGPDALANLQRLLTNDFSNLENGRIRYSPMCDEAGFTVDDLVVYRFDGETFMLVVNAANTAKDFGWIAENLKGEAVLTDISAETALLALQGPDAFALLSDCAPAEKIPQGPFRFSENVMVCNIPCLLSRTGYTGEDGFELYCTPADAQILFRAFVEKGVLPCGLGARDTLRLEAGMPLYGHELSAEISPLEAGLGRFVRLDKDSFIGKTPLQAPPTRFRAGLILADKGIAREGASVFDGETQIGAVTSGSHAPSLGKAVAMALLPAAYEHFTGTLHIDVRGRKLAANLVPLPFYRRK